MAPTAARAASGAAQAPAFRAASEEMQAPALEAPASSREAPPSGARILRTDITVGFDEAAFGCDKMVHIQAADGSGGGAVLKRAPSRQASTRDRASACVARAIREPEAEKMATCF